MEVPVTNSPPSLIFTSWIATHSFLRSIFATKKPSDTLLNQPIDTPSTRPTDRPLITHPEEMSEQKLTRLKQIQARAIALADRMSDIREELRANGVPWPPSNEEMMVFHEWEQCGQAFVALEREIETEYENAVKGGPWC